MMHLGAYSRTDLTLQDTLENPLVTVIACCYNHSAFVVESLESILVDKRIPTFSSLSRMMPRLTIPMPLLRIGFLDIEISCTYLRHHTNKGICKTLNEALSHAKGKVHCPLGDR